MLPHRVPLLASLSLLAACGPQGPGQVLLAPDAGRSGDAGLDGPHGVAWRELTVQVRLDQVAAVDVVYPALSDGSLEAGPWPAAVLVQGGLVAPERYRWLAVHLASRGVLTLMPHHVFDLALFEADNGRLALDALRDLSMRDGNAISGALEPDGPAVVLGHSLGGVSAAMQWADDDTFVGLGLLASYPAAGTPVGCQGGRPVLVLAGAEDEEAALDDLRAGYARFAEPAWMGVIGGMNHYSWTDAKTAADEAKEGAPSRDDSETRTDAQWALDLWTDAVLTGDDAAAAALDAGLVGVAVEWE
jgi:Alpha/beta hydrolase family